MGYIAQDIYVGYISQDIYVGYISMWAAYMMCGLDSTRYVGYILYVCVCMCVCVQL